MTEAAEIPADHRSTVQTAPIAGAPLLAPQPQQSAQEQDERSPEENMARRFPQPVTAGELIGRRVLDENRATIGRVQKMVRTPEGKIELIVTYGGLLGFGRRSIAVPIETVGAIGLDIALLDIEREDLDATESGMAPTANRLLPAREYASPWWQDNAAHTGRTRPSLDPGGG